MSYVADVWFVGTAPIAQAGIWIVSLPRASTRPMLTRTACGDSMGRDIVQAHHFLLPAPGKASTLPSLLNLNPR